MMKNFFIYSLISFLLCNTVQLTNAQPADRFIQVKGSVIDQTNNLPVGSAAVSLMTGNSQSTLTYTNASGKFTFESVRYSASVTIQVNATNYNTSSQKYSVKEGTVSFDAGRITLTPAAQTLPSTNYNYRFIQVRGSVIDQTNNLSVANATVTLLNGNAQSRFTYTNSSGRFTFDSVTHRGSVTIQVSAKNYNSFSQSYSLREGMASFDAGRIGLAPVTQTEPPVIPTVSYVVNNLTKNEILPTEGARELFYTLNPDLRGKDVISSDYKIRLPDFPRADRDLEKQNNEDFQKIKKQSNPDAFLLQKTPLGKDGYDMTTRGWSFTYADYKQNYLSPWIFKDNPEKFVFVIWKKDANGNAVLKGPQVENRFLVYYYPSYKEGDTSLYHKAVGAATYGYAPMWNSIYKIIVLDKVLNKVMSISDPVIETKVFFEKHDIFTLLNMHAGWIKIPIQIFD